MHKTVPSIAGSTSITVGACDLQRGRVVSWSGGTPHRIVNVNDLTLTVRPCHHWRWVEALHSLLEQWVVYPWRDWRARTRRR